MVTRLHRGRWGSIRRDDGGSGGGSGDGGVILALLTRRLRQSRCLPSVVSTHAKILKSGLTLSPVTSNHLINAYLRCGATAHAELAFRDMGGAANVVSWTSLMGGFSAAGSPHRALSFLRLMRTRGVSPNSFTLATALTACSAMAALRPGRQLHAMAELSGVNSDLVVSTALVGMYGKANRASDAREVFDRMHHRNIVSWGAMLATYSQSACAKEALELFGEFLRALPFPPNHFMLSSVVTACAGLGRLGAGKCTHAVVLRRGHGENDVVGGALVDMYAKCGCFEYSHRVFQLLRSPDVVPFSAMIAAAGKHGMATTALALFDEMLEKGVNPNGVTFLGVLHACSHAGLVDRGLQYLAGMEKTHGVAPGVAHYTCAVDMLGRAGRLDEAVAMARGVAAEGGDAALLWTALASAGATHGRLDVAAMAGDVLGGFMCTGRDVVGGLVTMANGYRAAGRWELAAGVRQEMARRGIRKDRGCSWVEVKDAVEVFYAGEVASCRRGGEVMEVLQELERRMRTLGYAGPAMADGEEPAAMSLHSERLALGFALISLPEGATIRVMKNLRMCRDCHEAFKLISALVGRKIVVRDLNRFHHFTEGSCSCGDYW